MEARSLQFSSAVRALTATARRLDLPLVPAFRSPPRSAGVERTLQRHRGGEVTVAVRLKGRPWPAVLADLVEGIVAANELTVADAAGVRAAMWSALQLAALVPGGDAENRLGSSSGSAGASPPTSTQGPGGVAAA